MTAAEVMANHGPRGVPSSPRTTTVLLVLTAALTAVRAASCKDEGNKDVEWFFLYKVPKDAARATPAFHKGWAAAERGEEYFYVDSRTPASTDTWPRSEHSIAEAGGALANTLAPLYNANKSALNFAYAAYNDQPPAGTETSAVDSHGHTKGVMLFDELSGAWLVHSVPDFPGCLHGGRYVFPESGRENGQVALCVTFPTSQLDTIDVYEAAVGVTLRTDVLASSWRNGGGGRLPPACGGPDQVLDVLEMRINDGNASCTFDNTEDHSKWAVSFHEKNQANKARSNDDYVCIGSLNRMHSQLGRGGETLCFRNTMLHMLLLTSVVSHDTCPKRGGEK